MAKSDDFAIELHGIDELIHLLNVAEKDIDRIVQEELSKFGKHVESVTKKLVHQDEGHLSDSINFDNAYKEGNSYIVSGGSNLPYALRRHEEPYRPGVHDKYLHGRHYPDYYVDGRGRGTRYKANYKGYEPGRKYLENAVKATESDYDILTERIINRILGENS